MAVRRSSFWPAVLLLASLDLWCSSSLPPCPESCVCRGALLLNCSSVGLSSVPQPVQDPIAELDLSHNFLSSVAFHQPHPNLRNLWLGNNSIPHLSLCIERSVTARRLGRRLAAGSRSRCLSWAPALQLLSAERNLLERLPRGLDAVESLQVLELSFNGISSLEPGVLGGLHQLRELHLQHNLITHLDPQMFQNLEQLKVLDLRFNMLTTMQQLTYLTLRDIGADVKLGGNRWRCDCNMRSIRRQMTYDGTRGTQTWNIICSEPSAILGKDLLQLDEEDLTCLSSENHLNFHQDVTVHSGAEILLSCSAQGSEWWTPDGRASASQQGDRLLISDFSEGDMGLYVCVSEEDHVLSVFNLQISKMRGARQERSVPGVRTQATPQTPTSGTVGETAGGFTQSDMALAVCLSILFTFLLAFILGVLARPCIDRLCRRVSKKKDSPATHIVTSAQQRHYDNQAFSNAEEPAEIGPHRERRVTFSRLEVTEERNMQYYDTVASGDQQSIRSDEVFEYQEVEVDLHGRPREKRSDDSSSAELAAERLRNMKFEPIPDPDELEERRSLSSSSDSSQSASESDQMTRKHTTPKSVQLVEDSFQTRADLSIATKTETPRISTKGKSEYPGSSALHTNKANTTDSDISQDDGELFEFSDGAQSPSAKNGYGTKRPGDVPGYSSSASSDSSDSDRESRQTKKQKTKKKQKKVAQKSKPGTSLSSSSHSESEEKMTYVDGRGRINTPQLQESKTKIDDSDVYWPAVDLQHIPRLKRRLDIKALLPSSDSSSSSESEDEPRGHVTKNTRDELMIARRPTNQSQKVSPKPGNQLPGFELKTTSANKRPLDTKVPTAGSDSSTSSDSDDDTTHLRVKKPGRLDVAHLSFQKSFPKSNDPADSISSSSSDTENQEKGNMLKQKKENLSKIQTKVSPTLSPKQDTDSNSSSSSDSDHDRRDHIRQQEELLISKFPTKVTQTGTQKAPSQWPSIDLGRVTRIKRRLDIKAPKAHSDSSSSSDSEDEARDRLIKQNQERLLMSRFPGKVSPTVHPKPENRWSAPELGKTTHIKKPVDIKASSTDSDSSSSSDSDNDRKDHVTSKKQMDLHISKLSTTVTTSSQKPETQWPVLDFGRVTTIKRRLDIKAPKADRDSSSSSDSVYETRGHIIKPKTEELLMSKLPSKIYPTVHPKPENRWSAPELGKTTQSKKNVDIKASSTDSDSSSSNDSGDDMKYHITQKNQEKIHISKRPSSVSMANQKPNQWPSLDFGRMTRIKRRLDIKAPKAHSDSSSSSDSEDETRDQLIKQKQEELLLSQLPSKVYPTVHPKPENRWSAPELGKTTQIKKPVDIKAASTESESSTSSDSDNEKKDYMTSKKQMDLHIPKLPTKVTTASQKPESLWPALDFGRVTRIKRRLDIKAPKADIDSSSSSDSEDETQTKKNVDIKASSTDSDSSSSSDSDNERKDYMASKKQLDLHIPKPPTKVTAASQKRESLWPALDFGRVTRIKRRLDIKAPKADTDSSSSSDSEYETQTKKNLYIKASSIDSDLSSSSDSDNERNNQITKNKQEELYISKLPVKVTTPTQKPANQWPTIDFGRVKRIKRRLDIKAPTADSESSSSSDSEDETRGNAMKQNQEELLMSKLPSRVYPTVHPKPENRWSAPDLGKATQIKKPVDIEVSSTDSGSSSSSDSGDDTKHHITQKKPANRWPTLDFGRATKVKRRLDIKAPTADSESSSSSNSENEKRGHVLKPKPEELLMSSTVHPTVHPKPENRWSAPDLGKIIQIQKPVDIKASSPDSDSSSSSDSDNERKDQITQKKQEELYISKFPFKVTTPTQKSANQWPTLDFHRVKRIKRRLDIKAPTANKDSSSCSDSEDETRGHVLKPKPEELLMSKLLSRVYPTVHPKPENRWSAPDLGKTTQIKKPVDIKASSTDSDSSSSSDSDNERKDQITQKKQEELYISKLPVNVATSTQKPSNQWPTLDFGRVKRIKRRLDIKAPTADSSSSSSSDSEDETRDHVLKQKPEELLISKLPSKVYPTVHPKPENRWSAPELGKTTQIKKPLDIKVSSTDSASSSSSDSGDDTKHHITQRKPANQWPTLDFGKVKQIKRHLDIKAPTADSSSSSDSEDETRAHLLKPKPEELLMSKLPSRVYPAVHPKPENHWSAPDLGKTTQIKKPVDIKVSSTDSDSSSSSDSDNERKDQITQKKQEELYISKLPTNVTTVTQKPPNQWPTLDFGRVTPIKTRLDIKAPIADSDSSSSSDNEDETRGHMTKQEELLISQLPGKVPPIVHPKSENHWSVPDLGKTKEFKNPLDTRAQSTDSDSSSGSDSDNKKDKTTNLKKEDLLITKQPVQTSQKASQKQGNQWPSIDLWKIRQFKRRLDIKAPAADSNSSSSSDSEDETRGHLMQQKQEELRGSTSFTKMSAKAKLENHWPSSGLGKSDIKSPLDIKVPSTSSDSSSSSEDEKRGHMKTQKLEEPLILRNPADIIQSLRPNSENQWPTLDLGQIPRIQRRLDIKTVIPRESLLKVDRETNLEGVNPSFTREVHNKASSPLLQLGLSSKPLRFKKSASQSSNSESEDENRDQKAKIREDKSFMPTASEKFTRLHIAPGINIPYNPKTNHNIKLVKYTDSSGDLENMPTNDTSRTTLEVDPELQSRWATMNLGVSRFRKRLEISSNATESDLNSPPDSPFSSGSESGSMRRQRLRRRFVGIQETTHQSSSPGLENFQLNMSPTPRSPEDKFTFSDIVKQRINKNHSDKDSTRSSKQSSNSSSSSDSEDETKDHSVTDLSRGVPRIKRRFDIKTPSPEPSNTPPFVIQNQGLTEHKAVQSTQASTIVGPTDESLITYKRSIFKSSSPSGSSFTPTSSRQTVDQIPNLSKDVSNDKDASLASTATKTTSFDDIIKRRRRQFRSKTDGDLMEKIKWTRVGHDFPDLSRSKSGGGVDATSKSLPQDSFTELTSPSYDSASSTTAFGILQLSKKSDATQTHKYSSLGPEVTPSPSGDVLRVLGNSSQRTPEMQRAALGGKSERKGLSALKAMSRERKSWEWDEDTHLAFDTQDGSVSSHSQSEKDKVLSRQSQIHSPSASESKKGIDLLLLYGVPRYKRHSTGDSLTEASLPDPATPQQED